MSKILNEHEHMSHSKDDLSLFYKYLPTYLPTSLSKINIRSELKMVKFDSIFIIQYKWMFNNKYWIVNKFN